MIDRAFWDEFNREIWERRPAHLGTRIAQLVSRREIFALAVNVGAALAAGNDQLRIRWCDDGRHERLLTPSPADAALLPRKADRDLGGYAARMARLPMFFFQLPHLHLCEPALWPRLVRFARGFYPAAGVPGQTAWTDTYFGRYTATPFGVHLDGASNFTFGVDGEKTLYLWEPDFYHAHMKGCSPHDYAPFAEQATKLTVAAGEVIYWPGRFFHIAVPDGRFSVTANFAFYPRGAARTWLERALSDLAAEIDGSQQPFPSAAAAVPSALAESARLLSARAAAGEIERRLLRRIVEHTTRLGLADPPPPRLGARFEPGDRIVQTRDSELRVVADGAGSVIVSANGYARLVPESDPLLATLRVLEAGRIGNVTLETRAAIEEMFGWGALERYWGQEGTA
jgi:hypothetical protein